MTTIQNKSNNVSTKGFQLYNQNAGEDSSTLALGFWNDMVSIKIHPMLPPNARQNGTTYNYNGGLSSVIGLKPTLKLIEAIDRIKRGDMPCYAVKGSTNTVIKIGDGTEYGEDFGWYLAIFETDERNVRINGWFYIFNENTNDDVIMADYDEETGTFTTEYINTEVDAFQEFLKSSMQIFAKTNAHSTLLRTGYMLDKLETALSVVKGMIEQMAFVGGGSSASSMPNVGAPNTSSTRNFASRRRRNVGANTGAGTQQPVADNSGSPAPTQTSRRRGGQTNPSSVKSVDESELERELLEMSDDEDLNLD